MFKEANANFYLELDPFILCSLITSEEFSLNLSLLGKVMVFLPANLSDLPSLFPTSFILDCTSLTNELHLLVFVKLGLKPS